MILMIQHSKNDKDTEQSVILSGIEKEAEDVAI